MAILGKVQIGKENPAAHGTPVAATRVLRTVQKPLPEDSKPTSIKQDLGLNVDVTDNIIQGKLVEDSLVFDQLTFQMLPLIYSALLKGDVTPVEQTADQDDYLYDHTPELDGSDNDLDSFTLERGDSLQAVEEEYVMFKRFKMGGQVDQSGGASFVKGEVDYFARQNTNTTFTPDLTPLAEKYMSAKLTQIFIDSTWANVGVTEKTNFLKAWDVEIIGGANPDFSGGEEETFETHEQGPISHMLALTMKRGAATEVLRAAKGEYRVIRLQTNGPAIGSGENQMHQLDLGGYIEEVIAMSEENQGVKMDTLVLRGMPDKLTGRMIEPKVITNVATL
jgi:hypothetical protein